MKQIDTTELVYLRSLSKQFPTIASAATEIINQQAILNLPKGTEHFLSDIHGEAEQFNHVLKNGSGAVRRKIDEEFGNTLSIRDKKSLATLIYYPAEKLDIAPAVRLSINGDALATAVGKRGGTVGAVGVTDQNLAAAIAALYGISISDSQ